MENNRLQFRHHTEVFESRDEAIKFLDSMVDNNAEGGALLDKSKMGEPIVVVYNTTDEEGNEVNHLILAIGKVDDKLGTVAKYQYIDADNILEIANAAKSGAEENKQAIDDILEKLAKAIVGVRFNGIDATITEDNIAELVFGLDNFTLAGYKKADEPHDIHETDTINEALGKLEAKADNNSSRIAKLENIEPDGITIIKTKPNDDSVKEYLTTAIQIAESTDELGTNQEKKYSLVDSKGNILGKSIIIEKDSFLDSVELVEKDGKKDTLRFVFMLGDKEKKTVEISLTDFIMESEFDIEKGLAVNNGVVSVKKDSTSESFFEITENGLRVTGISDAIKNAVKEEKNRAETVENGIADSVTAETSRATEAEDTLQKNIDGLSTSVDEKVTLAKEEVNGNINTAKTELTASIDSVKTELYETVANEKARATAEEAKIITSIEAESVRAETKEKELEDAIGKLNGDESAEGSVAYTAKSYANKETERATAKEEELANKILANSVTTTAPLTYTKSADGTIIGLSISGNCLSINGENGSLTTTFNLAYDGENNLIRLLGKDDKELARLSAVPFIKDGMLSDARVEIQDDGAQYLVLEWNLDAGSKKISIPVSTIFSPYEASNGITIDGKNIAVKKDETSEDANYLTIGVAGLGLSGITKAINDTVTPIVTRVATLETQMTGDTTVPGSVAHTVADSVNIEKVRAEKAEAELNTAITTVQSKVDTLNGDSSTVGSVKNSILNFKNGDLITKTVTTITPDDAKNQTLLFAIGTDADAKIYVSNDSKDMVYKGTVLETVIDELYEKIAAQDGEIAALKAIIEKFANLKGVDKEIKVTDTGTGFTIGFADDAIFGQNNR